jgi:hypothetical protein
MIQTTPVAGVLDLEFWSFEFGSDFGFRASDFREAVSDFASFGFVLA